MNQDSHFSRYSLCPISLFIEPILTTRCFKRNFQRTKKPFSVDLKSLKIHNRKYTASKKLHIADSINSWFFLLLYLGLGFWDLSSPVFHEKSKKPYYWEICYVHRSRLDRFNLFLTWEESALWEWMSLTWHLLITRHIVAKNHFLFSFFLLRCNTQRKFLCSLHSFQRKSEILHLWNAKLFHHWVLYFAQTQKKENNIFLVLLFI